MKIRTLFTLCVGVMLALNAGRAIWILRSFSDVVHEQQDSLEIEDAIDGAVTRVAAIAVDLDAGVRGWRLTGNPSFRRPYDDASRDRDHALALLVRLVEADSGQGEAAARVRERLVLWDDVIAFPLLRLPADAPDLRALTLDGERRMSEIQRDLASLRGGIHARRIAAISVFDGYQRYLRRSAILITCALLAVLFALWTAITRAIERPMARLVEHAHRVAGGELVAVDVRGATEVRSLATAWNRMVERLTAERAELARATAAASETSAELAGQQARLRAAFLALTDTVLLIDGAGFVELANPAAKRLLGPAVAAGHIEALLDCTRRTAPDGSITSLDETVTQTCLASQRPLHDVVRRMIRTDGGQRMVCINAVPIPGSDHANGAVVVIRDITEEHTLRDTLARTNEELRTRNEALTAHQEELRAQSVELAANHGELTLRNEELARASRLKSDFVATMSHELRTPLNAVIGFSDLLLTGDYGPLAPKQRPALEDVLSAGQQLLALINDVLDISKIEAGRVEVRPSSVDVAMPVGQACGLLADSAAKRSITLLDGTRACSVFASADPNRLRQVLINLISNAIKFTPDGGTVAIEASSAVERVRVAVTDTGIGIAPADAPKLFAPFSQLDTGYTRRFQGTGLGLSICKKLVELMGGQIGFTSEPGKGSTFFFTLPPASGLAPPPTTFMRSIAPSAPSSQHRGSRPNVLLVEDEELHAHVVESGLRREGYVVARARNAEEALAMIDDVKPGLFVVDLGLPGLSGLALIERIRALAEHEHTPIAVLSATDLTGEDEARLAASVQLIVHKGDASRSSFFEHLAGLSASRLLVLLVDDSETNRRVVRAMLQRAPCELIEEADAASGVRAARERAPDVILMDVQMPGMDGLTATAQLKADPATSAIPVIAVTAHAMTGDAEMALAAGCVAYVSKPVSRAKLNDALDVAMGGSGWRARSGAA